MLYQGTEGADQVDHRLTPPTEWNEYHGRGGKDTYKLYYGVVRGGAGADHIEKLPSANSWDAVHVQYWEAPSGVTVDLQAGWADDGWGTRDVLIGVTEVSGSGHADRLLGSAAANKFYVGSGSTFVDGRAGEDTVWLPVAFEGMKLSDYQIKTSVDGLEATITYAPQPWFTLTLKNVERIGVGYQVTSAVADFISPLEMASQGLTGLDANRWNASAALGSAIELSYSFTASAPASGLGASGFAAFTETQRAAVKTILEQAGAVSGLSFRLVASGGQLQFGASQQLDTKGVAAMPGKPLAGQVWMDHESLKDLTPGSEGYAALLHEIGHALGLRHPRNVDVGDAFATQWAAGADTTGRSVMAQTGSGDGLYPSGWGAYDIAALRYLYGSRGVSTGDTVYTLGEGAFGARTAIVDDGGRDTIDASAAVAGVAIDLVDGHLSSVGVTPRGLIALDNLAIAPGTLIEDATGSAHDDVILGNALNNRLTGANGNDWIDGAGGFDAAVFAGKRSDYLLSTGFGNVFVTARDGSSGFDTLIGIEQLQFKDLNVALSSSASGADLELAVDQNGRVEGTLPQRTDGSGAASYKLVKGPANGSVTLGADGSFTYVPRTGFHSEDWFSFRLSDASGAGNEYRAFIDVRALPATASGGAGADTIDGSAQNDIIAAADGDDRIGASAGSDAIDGGAGRDTVVYQLARAAATLSVNEQGVISLVKAGGTDTLIGIERVQFGDRTVAFDVGGNAGQAYRVYQAAFDRAPDLGGLGFWIKLMDDGMSLTDVAGGFMGSDEFLKLYGAQPGNADFVNRLYKNVLHRAPEQSGIDFWMGVLEAGHSKASVLAAFAESAENQAQLIGVISNGMEYIAA